MSNKLCVALSACNGVRFLQEQILTLENQTLPVDLIYIRDDGSSDGIFSVVASLRDE